MIGKFEVVPVPVDPDFYKRVRQLAISRGDVIPEVAREALELYIPICEMLQYGYGGVTIRVGGRKIKIKVSKKK